MTNKFTIEANGTKTELVDKSHAGIFRQFWAHFMALDLNKTIENIEIAGIRTSDQTHFVAVNGQKKKHIPVTENLYIYAHLTPAAMQKSYEKFVNAWEGKYDVKQAEAEKPAPVKAKPAEQKIEKPVEKKVDKPKASTPALPANFLPKSKLKTNAAEIAKRISEENKAKKELAKQKRLAKLNAEAEQQEKEIKQMEINL